MANDEHGLPADIMPLGEWVENVLLAENDFAACYIHIQPTDSGFDLEVEISPGDIGGTYNLPYDDRTMAGIVHQLLTARLREHGVTVYGDREAWEASWGEEGDDGEEEADDQD